MNIQLPEKQINEELLQVHSIFETIQGEGPFVGTPCFFIRLAGCNLQCPGCDTDYTSKRMLLKVDSIISEIESYQNKHSLVVITGGEPFRQNIAPLIKALLNKDYRVQIETNGTLYQELPYQRITVVCSPKTATLNSKLVPHISAYKYLISKNDYMSDDGLPETVLGRPCKNQVARPPKDSKVPIYIQPIDSISYDENVENLDCTIFLAKSFNHILCIQIHKLIGEA